MLSKRISQRRQERCTAGTVHWDTTRSLSCSAKSSLRTPRIIFVRQRIDEDVMPTKGFFSVRRPTKMLRCLQRDDLALQLSECVVSGGTVRAVQRSCRRCDMRLESMV